MCMHTIVSAPMRASTCIADNSQELAGIKHKLTLKEALLHPFVCHINEDKSRTGSCRTF